MFCLEIISALENHPARMRLHPPEVRLHPREPRFHPSQVRLHPSQVQISPSEYSILNDFHFIPLHFTHAAYERIDDILHESYLFPIDDQSSRMSRRGVLHARTLSSICLTLRFTYTRAAVSRCPSVLRCID